MSSRSRSKERTRVDGTRQSAGGLCRSTTRRATKRAREEYGVLDVASKKERKKAKKVAKKEKKAAKREAKHAKKQRKLAKKKGKGSQAVAALHLLPVPALV
mmetsp:Transcript_66963/g.132011  ORF Transcript_66963/g.132011 Transcript_66963/m.132011 type:complete len:101 (+) Transcript_66963:49-351(+)